MEICQDEATWKEEEEGRGGEEEKEGRKMENELLNAILAGEIDAAEGGVTRKAAFVAHSTRQEWVEVGGVEGRHLFSKYELGGFGQKGWLEGASDLRQKWDCSQIEDDFAEGDVMEWLEDDEMMKQWSGSKEEEKEDGRQERKSSRGCNRNSSFNKGNEAEEG